MPTYVYRCEQCDNEFEAVRRFGDAPLEACPQGHAGVKRIFTPAGIIFKGSGWYVKDSKNSSIPSGSSASKGESASAKSEAAASDGAKSETSTSSTAESKTESSKSEAA